MRIGIFGGSFNPVHLGHVSFVVGMQEAYQLDLVYVIVAAVNPFKKQDDMLDGVHRLKMCRLAFQGVPGCKVLSLELQRKAPSYTIDTVRELHKKRYVTEQDDLFLLLGEDAARDVGSWKESAELSSRCTIVTAPRSQDTTSSPIAFFDISATQIRERRLLGLYCGHLLHKDVYRYIQKHALY